MNQKSKDDFHLILPPDPRIHVRSMFGGLGAFVNGHMFAGVYGEAVFVRLSDADRSELLAVEGSDVFEPMPGRPMREYVVLPRAWSSDPARAQAWAARALASTAALPPKAPKPAKSKK